MSIVIGEFEVVSEPDNSTDATTPTKPAQPATAPAVTPDGFAKVEQYLAGRALRVWAD